MDNTITFDSYGNTICENIIQGYNNILVQACAGAGKTMLIIYCATRLPKNKKILIVAFNKGIQSELRSKISEKEYPNIEIVTYHSLGNSIFREKNKRLGIIQNNEKYKTRLSQVLKEDDIHSISQIGKIKFTKYRNNILSLIDKARFNLCHSVNDIYKIANKYSIKLIDDECEKTLEMLEFGRTHYQDIDYGDMVWLPNELDYEPYAHKYDYVFIDEAQDTSKAQQQLVFRTFKRGCRFFAFGDRYQCINSWAGADTEAFESFLKQPNTIELTLPVSRRCPKKVIAYVQEHVESTIKENPSAIDGAIYENVKLDTPQNGDMVLCRMTAPLAKYYMRLVSMKKAAYIKGSNIFQNLYNILSRTNYENLNLDLKEEGVFSSLYKMLFNERDSIIANENITEREALDCETVINILDAIKTLEILSDGLKTKTELIERVKEIFPDEIKDEETDYNEIKKHYIILSTVHKAKGLESDNVFILGNSLMPSRLAKQTWEIVAEENLKYVAYTRARKTLNFLDENEFQINNEFNNPETLMKLLEGTSKQINYIKSNDNNVIKSKVFKYTGNTDNNNTTIIKPRKIGGRKY